jgi:hypothetical protein
LLWCLATWGLTGHHLEAGALAHLTQLTRLHLEGDIILQRELEAHLQPLTALRELTLDGETSLHCAEQLGNLAGSLGRLTRLELKLTIINNQSLTNLSRLQQLQQLHMATAGIQADLLPLVGTLPWTALSINPVIPGGFDQVLAWLDTERAQGLEGLRIRQHLRGTAPPALLQKLQQLPKLHKLVLGQVNIPGDTGQLQGLSQLKELSLTGGKNLCLDQLPKSLRKLAVLNCSGISWLEHREQQHPNDCSSSNRAITSSSSSSSSMMPSWCCCSLGQLTRLDLMETLVSEEDLSRVGQLRQLKELHLGHETLTTAVLTHLGALTNLTKFTLSHCSTRKLDPEPLKEVLLGLKGLQDLEVEGLQPDWMSVPMAVTLASTLTNLTRLDLNLPNGGFGPVARVSMLAVGVQGREGRF